MATTNDLYTTVKNTSGASRFFGYLGDHGKTLANNGTTTVFGDLQTLIGNDARKKAALEADLLAGNLTLISTPRTVLYDASADAIINNPTVQATNAASTGGSLATGFYKSAYTFVSAWGETTVGTSLSAAHEVEDATNDRMVVTVPAPNGVTNCTAVNVYVTAMAASAGAVSAATLRKVGQVTGADTTLNVDTLPAVGPSNPAPPSTNTTEAHSVRAVDVDDNTLGTVDPSWGSYTG